VLRTIAGPDIDASPFPGPTASQDRFGEAKYWDIRVWLGKPQEFTFNIIASRIFFVTELSSTVYENTTIVSSILLDKLRSASLKATCVCTCMSCLVLEQPLPLQVQLVS
jgi:hypothetical protein